MGSLRIGVDSYGFYPLEMEPMEVLKWALANGAEGVQFSGLEPEISGRVDRAYLEDLRELAADADLYLEWGGAQHIPRDMTSWERKDLFEINRKAAEEAAVLGTRVVRSCSGGLMRWNQENPSTETLLRDTAEVLKSHGSMLQDHDVVLSIELHFEFTTFELLRLFEMCETEPGDYLGVVLDTMNLLTMLEDPISATDRILPWVTATHIKDGGLLQSDDGLVSFPAGIGEGVIDLAAITRRLEQMSEGVNLTIEDHGGFFLLPVNDDRFLSEFPDLTSQEYSELIRLTRSTGEKVDRGELAITEREEWPEICVVRLKRDIKTLKRIIRNLASE